MTFAAGNAVICSVFDFPGYASGTTTAADVTVNAVEFVDCATCHGVLEGRPCVRKY
jgi:hypothetical protein